MTELLTHYLTNRYGDRLGLFLLDNYDLDELSSMTVIVDGLSRLGYPHYEDDLDYLFDIETTMDRVNMIDQIRGRIYTDGIKWLVDMFGIEVDPALSIARLAQIVDAVISLLMTDDVQSVIDLLDTDMTPYEKIVRLLDSYSTGLDELQLRSYILSVSDRLVSGLLTYFIEDSVDDDTTVDTIPPIDRIKSVLDDRSIPFFQYSIPYGKWPVSTILSLLRLYGHDIYEMTDTDTIAKMLFTIGVFSTDTDESVDDIIDALPVSIKSKDTIRSKLTTYRTKYRETSTTSDSA